jgi:hypothetical protein
VPSSYIIGRLYFFNNIFLFIWDLFLSWIWQCCLLSDGILSAFIYLRVDMKKKRILRTSNHTHMFHFSSINTDRKVHASSGLGVRVMMFNATFNNISVISWWSVVLLEETGESHLYLPWYILFENKQNKIQEMTLWNLSSTKNSTLSWIFIVLAHWNSHPWVDTPISLCSYSLMLRT